jgi:hypothetical protein
MGTSLIERNGMVECFQAVRWRYHITDCRFCEIDSNGLHGAISRL